MTRRELEIQQAMKESIAETIYASGYGFTPQATDLLECAFIKGAQWADKTMIEKAWDWFYNMALDYMSGDITDVKWGSMKEDFFKTMEE